MTFNDAATARGRKLVRILGWIATPLGAIALATGIIESVTGTGVGWLFIVLGAILLGLGVAFIRLSTIGTGSSHKGA
ncbi:hypothetical protein [Curtobacterium sp. Leaf261]|jgi:hypothetical protein|uniref:hypothetical protein n=1 Tax=Curtobacterium sp. Leaf261 TaxID=1736311 RepID=UPI0012E0F3AD|nr:hypothetical protein [Curtobacterium sp. Leaf261]